MEPLIYDNNVMSPPSIGSNSPITNNVRTNSNDSNDSNNSNTNYEPIDQCNTSNHNETDSKSDHVEEPKLLSKIKTKSVKPSNQPKKSALPSSVLTRKNSKVWTDSNFDEYEQELIQQIEHLQRSQSQDIPSNYFHKVSLYI